MFEQFSNMTQQQLILLVGILVILLLLLDAYRRTRRKKYQAKVKPKEDKVLENVDVPEKEKNIDLADDEAEKDVAQEAKPSEDSDAAVEYQFEPVAETVEPEEEEPKIEEVPEEVLPEPKTWEEAVEQKRKQQMKANRSTQPEDETNSKASQVSGSNASTLNQGIIALHIMAPRNYVFYGEDLVSVFEHYQLNYSRDLQTYQGISNQGEVLFNATTAIKPGTFDLKKINELQTPGISFFMDINTLPNPKDQFKQMLSLLYKINEHLGGTLLNETRSRFTQSDVSRITASIKKLENPEEK